MIDLLRLERKLQLNVLWYLSTVGSPVCLTESEEDWGSNSDCQEEQEVHIRAYKWALYVGLSRHSNSVHKWSTLQERPIQGSRFLKLLSNLTHTESLLWLPPWSVCSSGERERLPHIVQFQLIKFLFIIQIKFKVQWKVLFLTWLNF